MADGAGFADLWHPSLYTFCRHEHTLLQAGLHLLHKTMLLLHGRVDGSQLLRQVGALLHSLLMLLLQLLKLNELQAVNKQQSSCTSL